MAKLSSADRSSLSSTSFGLPKKRKYPMPDASHAQNAKARASEEAKKGNITNAQKSQIDAKANKKLGFGTIHHKPGCPGNHLGPC